VQRDLDQTAFCAVKTLQAVGIHQTLKLSVFIYQNHATARRTMVLSHDHIMMTNKQTSPHCSQSEQSIQHYSAFAMTSKSKGTPFIHNTRENGALDMNGFPMASTSSHVNIFDGEPKLWSVPDSKKTKKQKDDTQWFFDHMIDDDTKVEFEPRRWDEGPKPNVKWYKKDDDLLDFLLKDSFQLGDTMPGLCSTSLLEDPAWEFPNDSGMDGLDEFSYSTGTSFFDEQALDRDKAKLFDTSKATSTQSGNNVSIDQELEPYVDNFCDEISAITTPTTSQQAQQSLIFVENVCWYRAKIASMLEPTKECIVRTEPLDVWPDDEVDSPVPLLIQVPAQELARRIVVMQQQMKSQDQMESLSKSQDETVRLDAEQRLQELWITSHKKKTEKSFRQDQCLVWI
jgi:hypothetical protein